MPEYTAERIIEPDLPKETEDTREQLSEKIIKLEQVLRKQYQVLAIF